MQSANPVGDLPARGEHDDRQAGPVIGELVEDLRAAAAGQHQIENDKVDVVVERQHQARVAVTRGSHREPRRGEAPPDEVGDPGLVLDHHDPRHAAILRFGSGPVGCRGENFLTLFQKQDRLRATG